MLYHKHGEDKVVSNQKDGTVHFQRRRSIEDQGHQLEQVVLLTPLSDYLSCQQPLLNARTSFAVPLFDFQSHELFEASCAPTSQLYLTKIKEELNEELIINSVISKIPVLLYPGTKVWSRTPIGVENR